MTSCVNTNWQSWRATQKPFQAQNWGGMCHLNVLGSVENRGEAMSTTPLTEGWPRAPPPLTEGWPRVTLIFFLIFFLIFCLLFGEICIEFDKRIDLIMGINSEELKIKIETQRRFDKGLKFMDWFNDFSLKIK